VVVAIICSVYPTGTELPCGVTATAVTAGEPTATDSVPLAVSMVAVIVVVPLTSAVNSPVWLIVATLVADETHRTLRVTSTSVPSELPRTARSCAVEPAVTDPLTTDI
jgi:hypothetical protein